jgi:hypothetical protein
MNIWLKIGFSERQLSATFLPLFKELASGRRSQPILYGLGLCGVTRDQKEQRGVPAKRWLNIAFLKGLLLVNVL